MKRIIHFLVALAVLFSTIQTPVFALSGEQNDQATKIANQVVDVVCEAAELQLSTQNLQAFFDTTAEEIMASSFQENDAEDPELNDVIGKRIMRKLFTRCPRKMIAWIAAQSSDANQLSDELE
ncbi:hypothetical protein [Synechococcus elongatus]|uniref:hypothetical protein n=1 Tax=Synechococcus elongatus TaxID=32046 RepID=UPI000F7EE5CB|nr:hypothetical protein [Synechococcus elongatus]